MSCPATPDNPCLCSCHRIEDENSNPLTGNACDNCPLSRGDKSATPNSFEDEKWLDIPEMPGYQISNFGRVKSLKRWRVPKDRIVKLSYSGTPKSRYPTITHQKKSYKIHRLVAKNFIPNPRNYSDVNHIDGDKYNNRVDNLEWCTTRHNCQHAFDTGLSKPVVGEKHGNAKFMEANIRYIRDSKKSTTELAKKFDTTTQYIRQIQRRIFWRHVV